MSNREKGPEHELSDDLECSSHQCDPGTSEVQHLTYTGVISVGGTRHHLETWGVEWWVWPIRFEQEDGEGLTRSLHERNPREQAEGGGQAHEDERDELGEHQVVALVAALELTRVGVDGPGVVIRGAMSLPQRAHKQPESNNPRVK